MTNEPPKDRALSLTAILADAINLGLAKMAEVFDATDDPLHGAQEGAFFHLKTHGLEFTPAFDFNGAQPAFSSVALDRFPIAFEL